MSKSVRMTLVGLALASLPGCAGDGSDTEPQAISGPPKQVAKVIQRLDRATRAGDFSTICNRLLTPAARLRAGGEGCEESLRQAAVGLRRPRIRIVSITIDGEQALARVRTRAKGQGAVDEAIELERRAGRYRIAALAG